MFLSRKTPLISAAVALALLAGCDSMPTGQSADDNTPEPPAVTEQQAQQQPQQQDAQQQSEQAVTATPVSFFLAQEQADERLTEIKMADGSLWAAPDAVLTRNDLDSVEPRRTQDGQAFLRFGFSEQGGQKLAQINERFNGNLLMVAVGNNVVGLSRIGESQDGFVDVAMESEDQAIAVFNAIAGESQE